jgi:hypothetical protein
MRWKVAMNLYAESNGTSATRGNFARVSSASAPSFAASTTRAASVGSPMTAPSSDTVASLQSVSPRASWVNCGTGSPAAWRTSPVFS